MRLSLCIALAVGSAPEHLIGSHSFLSRCIIVTPSYAWESMDRMPSSPALSYIILVTQPLQYFLQSLQTIFFQRKQRLSSERYSQLPSTVHHRSAMAAPLSPLKREVQKHWKSMLSRLQTWLVHFAVIYYLSTSTSLPTSIGAARVATRYRPCSLHILHPTWADSCPHRSYCSIPASPLQRPSIAFTILISSPLYILLRFSSA